MTVVEGKGTTEVVVLLRCEGFIYFSGANFMQVTEIKEDNFPLESKKKNGGGKKVARKYIY